jgi:hypothetical protein
LEERRSFDTEWQSTGFGQKADASGGGMGGGILQKKAMSLSGIYIHDTYRISQVETGFRWEDKRGNWIDYDKEGLMVSYGSRSGISGTYLYDESGEYRGRC